MKLLAKLSGRSIYGAIALFAIWCILSYSRWIGKTLIATPGEVFDVYLKAFSPNRLSEEFFTHAWYTITLTFHGWIISLFFGTIFGLLLAVDKRVYSNFEIIIDFFRSVPPILAFPLMLVAYNYGYDAYKYTIIFGCLPLVVVTVAQKVKDISKSRSLLLKSFGVSPIVRFITRGVEVLPGIILAARLTFSFALIIAIVTEMVFTPRSGYAIGALARDSEINFDTPVFYACVIFAGIVGYLINELLKTLEGKFI